MEIDITSVIIGLASLATFAVPIGYDQLKVKRAESRAKRQFLATAINAGFQHGNFDILGNYAAIGIGNNSEELLYVKNDTDYSLLELSNLSGCSPYKSQKKVPDSSGNPQAIIERGIRLSFSTTGDVKLPVFEGRNGTQHGDESIIIERWISMIKSAHQNLTQDLL